MVRSGSQPTEGETQKTQDGYGRARLGSNNPAQPLRSHLNRISLGMKTLLPHVLLEYSIGESEKVALCWASEADKALGRS